jgi:hypothetical protein
MMQQAARWFFREEKLPPQLLWWLTADGMRLWYRVLRWGLAPHLGGKEGAERVLARLAAPVFQRRYEILRQREGASLPEGEPGAVGLIMGALYLSPLLRESDWILAGAGGAPRGFLQNLRVQRLLAPFDARARWEEVATHLGEILIALTRGLPGAGLPRANSILGGLCFEAGARYGEKLKRAYQLPDTPASAIEVLRMSEYLFRVNPEHWSASDPEAKTGYIEGTACPWYTAPGWSMMHCGIFGQFQSGISSVFGLRYQLTKTIPKHGGHTCRIDLRPLPRPAG